VHVPGDHRSTSSAAATIGFAQSGVDDKSGGPTIVPASDVRLGNVVAARPRVAPIL